MEDLRKTHFAYVLRQLKPGRYVLLNRFYKPVGSAELGYLSTEEYDTLLERHAFPLDLPLALVRRLSWEGDNDQEEVFLYSDGDIPTRSAQAMRDYLERLALLMSLQVVWPRPEGMEALDGIVREWTPVTAEQLWMPPRKEP